MFVIMFKKTDEFCISLVDKVVFAAGCYDEKKKHL